MSYWAHSASDACPGSASRVGWQLLSEHLEAVAGMARELASATCMEDENFAALVSLAGLLHDFGKYSDRFQQMLQTGQGRCQHAIHGAMLACFGVSGSDPKPQLYTVVAAIAAHHAGLANWTDYRKKLSDLPYKKEAEQLVARAINDCMEMKRVVPCLNRYTNVLPHATRASLDLMIRMMFSCLVDADRLNSAGRAPSQEGLHADEKLQDLLKHLDSLQQKSTEGIVKQMRAEVLLNCLDAAPLEKNLFSLSVPTGGGKTLAAMAFALRRAALYPKRFRRVIVVIPYLSIIEQNARVYAEIFGQDALLEHHSGSAQKLVVRSGGKDEDHFSPAVDKDDEEEKEYQETGQRIETENWDAPLIVTTSVRFFESLFSNRPSDLRRVHNVARSIVILDEVQTLPRKLLGPLLDMMQDLSAHWGTNFVFSTATQPAFERSENKHDLRWKPGTLTEMIHDPASLHKALCRVKISWEIDTPAGWPQIARRMMEAPQCLAIVNVRDHANLLYAELLRVAREATPSDESVFHLSTRMCAAHRLRALDAIRARLKAGQACRVVSTQLVEAGVDVDFPLVLRALAPLDSIIQAAGRADREGKLTAAHGGKPGGKVVVFLPEDHKLPPNEYKEAAGKTETLVRQALEDGKSVQVDSLESIRLYFERYYGSSGTDLGGDLLELRKRLEFATLAQEFEMISSRTRDVFVPDDEEAERAIEALRASGILTPQLRRVLQRHVVGLSPSEFAKARGVIEQLPSAKEAELWAATSYDKQLGLIFDPGPEQLVL